jgi:hypothetical protein
MLARISFGLALLLALPVWGQEDQAPGSPVDLAKEAQMLTPPPISGLNYSTELGSETHFNYLRTGIAVGSGYIHNVEAGSSSAPVNDTTYFFQPSVAFDRSTARSEQTFSYNPAFALYQPTSTLNTLNQTASVDLRFHLTPHTFLRTGDAFNRTSASFGAGSAPVTIAGSPSSVTPGVLAPFAPEITNRTTAVLSWQGSSNDMLAVSGLLTTLDFTNSSQAAGFYNSTNRGGSASYTHRLTDNQYVGVIGEYARIVATPLSASLGENQSDTRTAGAFGFYTMYFQRKCSLSLVGGPQHYALSEYSVVPARAWSPAGMASLGWQGYRTSIAASASHTVTGGSGILGAFETNTGSGSFRWHPARTWTLNLGGSYSKIATVDSQFGADSMRGGHSASGTFSVDRAIGSSLDLTASYTRLHQTYSGIAAISANPTSDNVTISLFYRFSHPLGR